MNQIQRYLEDLASRKPYELVLLLALFIRMLAVVFSQGFGMHDDHFLVIEPAAAWRDGINYQGWFPSGGTQVQPDGHSLLYSGFHLVLFYFFNWFGLEDPKLIMLLVRLLHALLSLWVVSLGYKMTRKMADDRTAFTAGMLLALLWFIPMMSVRNLVEMVCIPFMMSGIWILMQVNESGKPSRDYLLAGIIMGIGFSVRFQTAVFIAGTGLVLLILKEWRGALIFGLGVLAAVLPVQGGIDYLVWSYPFAEFMEYVRYNLEAAHDYITGPWYNYILLLGGMLIPPVSLFLLAGFFRLWKKQLLIWLPAFLFLLFHSIFPNKQERFIFPVIPFVIVLGVAGWAQIVNESVFWQNKKAWLKGSWIFFWAVNVLLLTVLTVSYSKKSRVEAMYHLSAYKGIEVILLEDIHHESAKMMPLFYMKQWPEVISVTSEGTSWHLPDPGKDTLELSRAGFVCFFENRNLEERVDSIRKILPNLEYEASFKPGFMDRLMFRMNPVNLNQEVIIYRNKDLFPNKIKR